MEAALGRKRLQKFSFPKKRRSWLTILGGQVGDQRLVPGEVRNPGMRFCIPGMIFQGHRKHTWMSSAGFHKIGV